MCKTKLYPLADPGGAAGTCPPTGSISFIFTYVFIEKCMHQRLAPPNGSAPPQWEILDPPLNYYLMRILVPLFIFLADIRENPVVKYVQCCHGDGTHCTEVLFKVKASLATHTDDVRLGNVLHSRHYISKIVFS